ncbi:MAG: hypothetical protein ACTSRZ_04730 [Promethearchaeota archaeon]
MSQKDEKILISLRINKNLLAKWDNFCAEKGISRTNLIKNAVEAYLNQLSIEKVIEELLFKYINAIGKNLEKRIIIEFENIKEILNNLT